MICTSNIWMDNFKYGLNPIIDSLGKENTDFIFQVDRTHIQKKINYKD